MNNITQAMSLYLVGGGSHIPVEIIRDDKHAYATGVFAAIRVPLTEVEHESIAEDQFSAKVSRLFRTEETSVSLPLSTVAVDAFVPKDRIRECKECKGSGTVDYEYESSDGSTYSMNADCPVCDGDGEVGKEKPNYIRCNGHVFSADSIHKLCQVRDMIGGDITMTCVGSPNQASQFRVGVCDVILMPARKWDGMEERIREIEEFMTPGVVT